MTAPPRLFVTDCEGPLTRNDNAMEVTAAFVPDGAELFARLSRYDDFLADVLHKPGYNAGDTLRLIVPFLLAYGVGDRDVEEYSADTVLVVPGARDLLRDVAARPALVHHLDVVLALRAGALPRDRVSLRAVPLHQARPRRLASDRRRGRLAARPRRSDPRHSPSSSCPRRRARRPTCRPPTAPPSPPSTACSGSRWAPRAGAAPTSSPPCARSAAASSSAPCARSPPAGASTLADVMYVGDSITDVPPFTAVREAGGVALSFNGNRYALAAAELAAAAADTGPTRELALAFADGGREAVLAAIASGRRPPSRCRRSACSPKPAAALAHASAYARSHVRGERVARLG